jgi:hypothetical protein
MCVRYARTLCCSITCGHQLCMDMGFEHVFCVTTLHHMGYLGYLAVCMCGRHAHQHSSARCMFVCVALHGRQHQVCVVSANGHHTRHLIVSGIMCAACKDLGSSHMHGHQAYLGLDTCDALIGISVCDMA